MPRSVVSHAVPVTHNTRDMLINRVIASYLPGRLQKNPPSHARFVEHDAFNYLDRLLLTTCVRACAARGINDSLSCWLHYTTHWWGCSLLAAVPGVSPLRVRLVTILFTIATNMLECMLVTRCCRADMYMYLWGLFLLVDLSLADGIHGGS